MNPLAWRGVCFGRTLTECCWTGTRQMRWARGAYGGSLGSEYVMPVQGVGHHGFLSDIKALCGLYFAMSCVFSCGVGQIFSLCGNLGCNFGAWFSCHSREKIRRRFHLPPTFGLPPGIDDFLVHCLCYYCASHQELRELAVRGIDGPGMHIFDVLPDSFNNAPGAAEAVAKRKALVEAMLQRPPAMFRTRGLNQNADASKMEIFSDKLAETAAKAKAAIKRAGEDDGDSMTTSGSEGYALGWMVHPCHAPQVQEMEDARKGAGMRRAWSAEEMHHVMVSTGDGVEGDDQLIFQEKAWSVAY